MLTVQLIETFGYVGKLTLWNMADDLATTLYWLDVTVFEHKSIFGCLFVPALLAEYKYIIILIK